MPELMRSIVARVRQLVVNRRHARRHQESLPCRLSLFDPKLSSDSLRRPPAVQGVTQDISASGFALIVPAIRIGGRYLTTAENALHLTIELPTGPIEILVTPTRYERLEEGEFNKGYIIGLQIKSISDEARARLREHLATSR